MKDSLLLLCSNIIVSKVLSEGIAEVPKDAGVFVSEAGIAEIQEDTRAFASEAGIAGPRRLLNSGSKA